MLKRKFKTGGLDGFSEVLYSRAERYFEGVQAMKKNLKEQGTTNEGDHTEGKWEIRTREEKGVMLSIDVYAKDTRIAGVTIRPDRDALANARLIAAAPEMLEALKDMEEYLEFKLGGWVTEYGSCHAIVHTARRKLDVVQAAIAKATRQVEG